MDIGAGDWVECVHNGERGGLSWPRPELVVGGIYSVARLDPDYLLVGYPVLWLNEQINPEQYSDGGYAADRFRPIYRPKASLIQSLLEKQDA